MRRLLSRTKRTKSGRSSRTSGSRTGYTLLEVLLYASLLGVIGGSFVAVLRSVYVASTETTHMVQRAGQWHRFARDWVRDVHAARNAEVIRDDAGRERFVLKQDGQVDVQYLADADRIRREERHGETVTHRETYLLFEPIQVRWPREEDDSFLEVRVWRSLPGSDGRVLFRSLSACLAADWRYAGVLP